MFALSTRSSVSQRRVRSKNATALVRTPAGAPEYDADRERRAMVPPSQPRVMPVVAVHGGAGSVFARPDDPVALRGVAALRTALQSAHHVLDGGGSALEAVVAAVCVLEDAEELNAGRGAALTEDGTAECCAAVADGAGRGHGAAALTTTVRNPVKLAQHILSEGRHVLMAGPAADALAASMGLEVVSPAYFVTGRRLAALKARSSPGAGGQGTVGAVARDASGHLAAATSTGGITAKRSGRIGDTPIPGAGSFADDTTCAVSATGDGDVFLRAGFAYEVHARLAYTGATLTEACDAALGTVANLGGAGGCAAVDAHGRLALPFTTAAMFRGWCAADGEIVAGVFPGDVPTPPIPRSARTSGR